MDDGCWLLEEKDNCTGFFFLDWMNTVPFLLMPLLLLLLLLIMTIHAFCKFIFIYIYVFVRPLKDRLLFFLSILSTSDGRRKKEKFFFLISL